MKKSIRILLYVGLAALVVGAIVCVAALAATGWKIDDLSSVRAEMRTFTEEESDEVKSIDVDFNNAKIVVQVSKSAQRVSVEYPQMKDASGKDATTLTVQATANAFTVKETQKSFFQFGFNTVIPVVTVTLPTSRTYTLRLRTSNGEISVQGATLLADEVLLETKNGNVGCTVQTIEASGNVLLDTKNGKIEVQSPITAGESVRVETKNGEIRLTEKVTAPVVAVETKNGRCSARNIAANDITFGTNVGDVDLNVDGARSDYTIEVTHSLGNCNVSNQQSGEKTLRVFADTGNIEVYFTR